MAIDLNAPVGVIALVTALQPLLTGALSGTVTGEHTRPRQWIGLTVGFLGVATAVGARLTIDDDAPAFAYLLPLVSVIGITTASLLQRRWAQQKNHHNLPLDAALFYQCLGTTLAVLLPAWLAEGFDTQWTTPFIATMAWLIIAVSLGAYYTMWKLIERKDATRVASLFYLSPPVTMIMAYLTLGDRIAPTDILGLAITAIGITLVYQHKPKHTNNQSHPQSQSTPN